MKFHRMSCIAQWPALPAPLSCSAPRWAIVACLMTKRGRTGAAAAISSPSLLIQMKYNFIHHYHCEASLEVLILHYTKSWWEEKRRRPLGVEVWCEDNGGDCGELSIHTRQPRHKLCFKPLPPVSLVFLYTGQWLPAFWSKSGPTITQTFIEAIFSIDNRPILEKHCWQPF